MQIVVNSVLTNYEVVNPKVKKTVLILHGWGQNASLWLPLTKLLSENYCYYLLDLPGFGSTRDLAPMSDVPEYTEFVKNFIDKLKLKDLVLFGHSFGGQIAANLVIIYPKLISKLILIDASVIRTRNLITKIKILVAKIAKPISKFVPSTIINPVFKKFAADSYHSNKYQKSVLNRIVKYDLTTKLQSIKVPTEIVWGSEDKLISYAGKFLVENIPDSHLHLVYGAGHSPHLSHPAKLANILCQIL